jgi:hypothetical protein
MSLFCSISFLLFVDSHRFLQVCGILVICIALLLLLCIPHHEPLKIAPQFETMIICTLLIFFLA